MFVKMYLYVYAQEPVGLMLINYLILSIKNGIYVLQSYVLEGVGSPINIQWIWGIDYVVIGFDMEVQPLVTHNAA